MDWKLISLTELHQHRGPCATRGRYAGRPPHSRYAARPPHDRYAEPLRGAETFLRMDIRKNKSLSLCGQLAEPAKKFGQAFGDCRRPEVNV